MTDQPASNPAAPFTALVLAASRRGPEDPVAQIQGLSHKAQVALNGVPMVLRVIRTLMATPQVGRIYVSVESPDVLTAIPELADLLANGSITAVDSKPDLFQSVMHAVTEIDNPCPMIISTADNALHTPEMYEHFCTQALEGGEQCYIGITRAQLILDKYPEGQRAFHRLKDDAYSSCNLYALMDRGAVSAAKAFATGGQFGKKPMRILKAFGLIALIMYKWKLVSLDGVMRQISRKTGMSTRAILMPWAEGPIDVDNAKDYALVTKILEDREGKAEAAA